MSNPAWQLIVFDRQIDGWYPFHSYGDKGTAQEAGRTVLENDPNITRAFVMEGTRDEAEKVCDQRNEPV